MVVLHYLGHKHFFFQSAIDDCPLLLKKQNLFLAGMQYVVSIDSSEPFLKWQMERGLDRTISSVAGESYWVDVSAIAFLRFNWI